MFCGSPPHENDEGRSSLRPLPHGVQAAVEHVEGHRDFDSGSHTNSEARVLDQGHCPPQVPSSESAVAGSPCDDVAPHLAARSGQANEAVVPPQGMEPSQVLPLGFAGSGVGSERLHPTLWPDPARLVRGLLRRK